jgi:hypothetical protein
MKKVDFSQPRDAAIDCRTPYYRSGALGDEKPKGCNCCRPMLGLSDTVPTIVYDADICATIGDELDAFD